MRTLITCLFVIAVIALTACDQPHIASTDENTRFTPGAASGRWVIINYWAKWCAPCREEIPELNHFAAEYADQVQVLGVNYDGLQGEALAADIEALGIQFPILLADPHPALGIERPTALPATLLIAPDGSLKNVLLGPQTAEVLAQHIQEATPEMTQKPTQEVSQ